MKEQKLRYLLYLAEHELPGLYVFKNESTKEFYVGMTRRSLIVRVREHIMGGKSGNVTSFIRKNDDMELFVKAIENIDNYSLEEIQLMEYATYLKLIDMGYKSVNEKFSQQIKDNYDALPSKMELREFFEFSENILDNRYKEMLINRRYKNMYKSASLRACRFESQYKRLKKDSYNLISQYNQLQDKYNNLSEKYMALLLEKK